ncbi:MAG: NAD-dependent epimerase/dehydratase family protein [Calditrichia bacterium]
MKITKQALLRVIVDLIMINFAFFSALMLRFLWATGIAGNIGSPTETFDSYFMIYLKGFAILSVVSFLVFYYSGFYTFGKAYKSKYKLLVVFEAVSLSYLIFGSIEYFTGSFIEIPRAAFFISWGFTLVIITGSRLWSDFWKSMAKEELDYLSREPQNRAINNVLVLGGAGYIGSALIPKLLEKGYKVRLVDLLLFGTAPIKEVIENPNLEIMKGDFRQIDIMVEAMRDIDAVIHLGAIVGDPACALDEELTIEINLMATKMIAEIAKGHGVERFIFASTCSVYGASNDVLDESSELNPVSLYARSKIASERVLMKMADERFAPVILRFSTIYGFSGRTRFDLVVNLLTAKAIVEGEITVFGGNQWRPFVHVDDAALAVFKVLRAPLPAVNGEIFNVGSDEQNYTISEVGDLIKKIITDSKVINMGSDTDARNYKVSFQKIRKNIEFLPNWSVEKGIRQVYDAFRDGKIADYKDARYSNVKFLSEEAGYLFHTKEKEWMETLLKDTTPVEGGAASAKVR